MSTVVVVRKGNEACIACDTLLSLGDLKQSNDYYKGFNKIVKFGNSWVGLVGAAASHVALNALFGKIPSPKLSTPKEIFQAFVEIHEHLKNDYLMVPSSEPDCPYEVGPLEGVIMNKHGIFGILPMREVFEYKKFWAVGSGSVYALGAMGALYDSQLSASEIAKEAVKVAAEFDSATALPIKTKTKVLVDS